MPLKNNSLLEKVGKKAIGIIISGKSTDNQIISVPKMNKLKIFSLSPLKINLKSTLTKEFCLTRNRIF